MKIKISTDSTADIPKSFCDELNITVLPLTINYDGKEYRDGIDITTDEMYKILDSAKTLPVSSQVAVNLYTKLFEDTLNEGYSDLIHTSLNSKGSGTYQAGILAKELFFEEHPEAKDRLNIHIIDSKTYSMTYGIAVIEAAQLVQKGADAEQVIAHIEDFTQNSRPLFVPLDLKCVKKSGRISPAAAFVGDAIGLKPIITFEDGEAKIIGKVRGENKAISELIDLCVKEKKPNTNYVLAYGNNKEVYEKFKKACIEAVGYPPLTEFPVGCIISINTGPNMIAVLYRR